MGSVYVCVCDTRLSASLQRPQVLCVSRVLQEQVRDEGELITRKTSAGGGEQKPCCAYLAQPDRA